jgi:hypothetical protein
MEMKCSKDLELDGKKIFKKYLGEIWRKSAGWVELVQDTVKLRLL